MTQDSASADSPDSAEKAQKYEEPGKKRLTGLVYWIALFYGGFGIAVAINQTISFNAFGFVLLDSSYYYLLIGIFIPLAFLIFPAISRHGDRVPFYD
jgi:hypothetical protein